jgi:hypothetical protein
VCLVVSLFLLAPFLSRAAVFESDNFRIVDPTIDVGGGRATSASFILLSALGELALGTSTATTFSVTPGFLAFPTVNAPVPSAAAGDGAVTLTWTAATAFTGWTVGGYSVGQSTSAGGPYTYASVGNVLTSIRGSLSNGTTYYFVVLPEDAFGNRIATSSEVSAAPIAAAAPAIGKSGGIISGILPGPAAEPGPFVPPTPPRVVPPLRPPAKAPPEAAPACRDLADFNGDGFVNIRDLSILLYFADRGERIERHDINEDGTINIVDISIMFYCWS